MGRKFAIMVAIAGFALSVPASAQALGWASEALSHPKGGESTSLTGISCTGTSFCMAAGGYEDSVLERPDITSYSWNGTNWANLGGLGIEHPIVNDVSCTSNSFCVMVGSYGEIENEGTLALHWDGSKWKLVTTPNPGSFYPQTLKSVSCTATNACTAVGWKQGKGEVRETLAIRWNGTSWSAQTTPNPGATENVLKGVSCTSSAHCVAVGDRSSGGGTYTTLAMTWNETTWSTQTTPNPTGAVSTGVEDVSCTSSSACTAVGVTMAVNGPLGYAMRWNGSTWALQQVKLPTKTNFGWLYGVSCFTGTFCMAVGAFEILGSGTFMMSQKWDGTSWTAEKPPSPGPSENLLRSVSCVASNWCKAVGVYSNGEGKLTPVAEHFSG